MNSKKNHNAMNTDNNLSQNRDMKAGMMVDTKPIKMDSNSSMELTALELAELRALIVAKRAMKPVITLPVKKEIRKVMMKKTEPFVNVSYRPFKFLSIDVNKKNILIKTKRTHELVRFFVEKATNRFVFDFKGRIDNATLRKTFQNNKYFKGYIIGSHKYKGFFRVVILNKFKNVYKYDVKTKNNLVDIKFIK
jgi:hypothetical protein